MICVWCFNPLSCWSKQHTDTTTSTSGVPLPPSTFQRPGVLPPGVRQGAHCPIVHSLITSTVISSTHGASDPHRYDERTTKHRWCNKRRLAMSAGNWPCPRPVWEEEEGDGCFIQHDPISDQILPQLAIRDKNSHEHVCKLDEGLPPALLDTQTSLLYGRHNVGVSPRQNPAVDFCQWLGTGRSKALGAATLRNICFWEVPV